MAPMRVRYRRRVLFGSLMLGSSCISSEHSDALFHGGDVDVSHLDLYRFVGVSSAEWGDLEPYFDETIAFVEWPEAGEATLPAPRAVVTLAHRAPEERELSITSDDEPLLQGLVDGDPGSRHGD